MGLDQYAYIKNAESGDEGESPKFIWRKHSQLQTFMEALYTERTGLDATDLNCGELMLQASDIDRLEKAVEDSALPHCEGGFFYGHQFQDEQASEYRDYDLDFCAWARTQIQAGSSVIYSCWW
ncbi:phosphoglycerate kinase [uncultured Litoreibacter sp.]|uniref:phosphoglycerate kinase n=1 Tax=uncultured Litoreibacter sp. TaxID=1392394 RepID=UPI00262912EB|nr:phosphoglycerate kinase [uncultured Litoreibacter sp.]